MDTQSTQPSNYQPMPLNIPEKSDEFFDLGTPSFVELFTDGSCNDGTDPMVRLAGWGVVVGTPNANQEFSPVASGLVPGFVQTISRAELIATLAAFRFGLKGGKPFRIWSVVIKQINKRIVMRKFTMVPNKIPNHDPIDQIR